MNDPIHQLRQCLELPGVLRVRLDNALANYEAAQYGAAMNFMFDFIELSMPYVSAILMRLLGDAAPVAATVVQKIDRKRPLSLGDWVNDIFTPLLIEARRAMPAHPVVSVLADTLMHRRQNRLLGSKTEPSVVYLRNIYKGHTTTLANEIYADVCLQLMPHVQLMARAIEPLAHMQEAVTADGRYTLTGSDGTIDLYPFVLADEKGDILVFHTLKDEEVAFISTNPKVPPITTDAYNAAFDACLQRILPSFDISLMLNWHEISLMARERSDAFLHRIYRQKKYNRELFVDRTVLSQALSSFLASDATLFPLIGEAGQGKTNQLCYWTETLREQGTAVLIFGGDEFAAVSLPDRLKGVFGYSRRKDIGRLIDDIHLRAAEAGARLLIIFDAVNECSTYAGSTDRAPLALYTDICRTLGARGYTDIKVLMTCRTYTWKNLLVPATAALIAEGNVFGGDDERYRVRGFDDEEFARAYTMYSELYQMQTPIADIDLKIRLRMHDPLVLKFTATGFLGKKLSTHPLSFTSIALYERMWADIDASYAGHRQTDILTLIGEYLLRRILRGENAVSVSVADLRDPRGPYRSELSQLSDKIYGAEGLSIAYAELLNKSERPVLREAAFEGDDDTHIQFVYERFLEYVIARAILSVNGGRVEGVIDAIFAAGPVSVVTMGAVCNALIMYCTRHHDFSPLIRMAAEGDDFNTSTLVSSVMDTLITDNYEKSLFEVERRLISASPGVKRTDIADFNATLKLIEANKATPETIARYRQLYKQLEPTIRLRRLAITSIVHGMLLTDYYVRGLYTVADPLQMVWTLMVDDILDVRNDTCTYIYYLANRTHTHQYTELTVNMAERLVDEMFTLVRSRYLVTNLVAPSLRKRMLSFIENGIRLTTLLIIDAVMINADNDRAARLLGQISAVVSYFSWRFNLVKAVMPFFQIVLRKQITFQSDYCNNAIEYASYWDDNVIPADSPDGWSRPLLGRLIDFLPYYRLHHADIDSTEARAMAADFHKLHPAILDAYHIGNAFSFFALERVMVIMGCARWENVAPVVREFFGERYRQDPWFDYSQMSMLYSLYQIAVHSGGNREILDIFTRECRDWTLRCRGVYKAHGSAKANRRGVYKRNLLNWYAEVYCAGIGDGAVRDGDAHCAPLAYELIDRAIADTDKELLWHIMEATTEMVTDNRLIHTALGIVKYILASLDTTEKIERFDACAVDRDGVYTKSFVEVMGYFFSTAKNYFPDEINRFLRRDISGMPCPAVASFREDILNFTPAGETLSDLLTHKFGNFLMWALLNQEQVIRFSVEAMKTAPAAKDCVAWYNEVVKMIFRHMFNVKL